MGRAAQFTPERKRSTLFQMIDPIATYALVVAGIYVLLLFSRLSRSLARFVQFSKIAFTRRAVYPYLIPRWRWIGPWTRIAAVQQLLYTSVNIFLVCYRTDLKSAGQNAGVLALVNMAPMYLSPHLSYGADQLNVSLSMFRSMHRKMSFTTTLLSGIHFLIFVYHNKSLLWSVPMNLYGLVCVSCVGALTVLSCPLLRRPSYELYLRTHQMLAAAVLYSLWQHVKTGSQIIRYGVLGIAASTVVTSLMQVIDVLLRNRFFYHGLPRAGVERVGDAVCINITLPMKRSIRAGQFLNVYMPGFSFWSFLQSHPFMVASVQSHVQGIKLQLLVEPRRGWTNKLWQYAHTRSSPSHEQYVVFFSGPHGKSAPVNEYGIVLLATSGWGIMAQMPYLQHLIRSYNNYTTKTRRIHLIWQLDHIDDGLPAVDLLNRALLEDTLDDGYILAISIYAQSSLFDPEQRLGQHRRVTFFSGVADWETIVQDEVDGKDSAPTERTASDLAAFSEEKRKILVSVSSSIEIREKLRNLVCRDLCQELRLIELDYQPS